MVNKEELIVYLKEQKDERDKQLADYDVAVAERDEAKLAYERAEEKVESFGDVEKVKVDREKIEGFIEDLERVEEDPVESEQETVATATPLV